MGLAVLVLSIAMSLTPPASAHTSGTITRQGSFSLTPAGTANETFHALLSTLGFPIGPGDTLRFSWFVNGGGGPPVYFEIHAHPQTSGYVRYYSVTAATDTDSWSIPGSDAYMVLWANTHNSTIAVSYAIDLIPPLDLTPLIIIPVVVGIVLILLRGRKPKPSGHSGTKDQP